MNHAFAGWRKARESANNPGGGCVEVGASASAIGVRDSKLPGTSPVLAFTASDWTAFLGHLRTRTSVR